MESFRFGRIVLVITQTANSGPLNSTFWTFPRLNTNAMRSEQRTHAHVGFINGTMFSHIVYHQQMIAFELKLFFNRSSKMNIPLDIRTLLATNVLEIETYVRRASDKTNSAPISFEQSISLRVTTTTTKLSFFLTKRNRMEKYHKIWAYNVRTRFEAMWMMLVVYVRHSPICAQLSACSETKLDGKHVNPERRQSIGPSSSAKIRAEVLATAVPPCDRFDSCFYCASRNSLYICDTNI